MEGPGVVADHPGPHGVDGRLSRERVEPPATLAAGVGPRRLVAAVWTEHEPWHGLGRGMVLVVVHCNAEGSAGRCDDAVRSCADASHEKRTTVPVMMHRSMRLVGLVVLFVCVRGLAACSSASPSGPGQAQPNEGWDSGVEQAERYVGAGGAGPARPVDPDPVVARLGNEPVRASDLRPKVYEFAGGLVLEEHLLDRLIEERLRAEGMTVTDRDVEAELETMLETVRDAAGAGEDLDDERAGMMFERLRRGRGLGQVRLTGLLERNAGLRMLVRDRVTISEQDLAEAHRIVHGPKAVVRIITVPSQATADQILDELDDAEPERMPILFAELAARRSTDPSAPRGGLLGELSPSDPRLASGVRETIRELELGELSPMIAIESGYAIVLLEREIPASGITLEEARPTLERDLRQQREREAMEALAAALLRDADIQILDPHLSWNWSLRRN